MTSTAAQQAMSNSNYLQIELYELLRERPEVFEFLQNASLDGLWYWDLENPEQEWMNARFWEILGLDPATKQHLASEWQDLIHPDDLQTALQNFEAHCADPEYPYDQIVRYRHADGSTVWVRCHGLAIRNAAGTPVRMLGAHNELTELKQTEAQLRERGQQLQALNEELEAYSYAISHDLQGPLRTISGFNQLILRRHGDALPDEVKDMLALTQSAAADLGNMIESVLQMSRVEHGQRVWKPVDLDQAWATAQRNLQQDIADSGAVISASELGTVPGDRNALTRVLQNLLENALKYRIEGQPPQISIVAERDALQLQLSLTDNGRGVPAGVSERLIQAFERDERANIKGLGIGLATCQRILQKLGGRLSLQPLSNDGGTKVQLWLPLQAPAAQSDSDSPGDH